MPGCRAALRPRLLSATRVDPVHHALHPFDHRADRFEAVGVEPPCPTRPHLPRGSRQIDPNPRRLDALVAEARVDVVDLLQGARLLAIQVPHEGGERREVADEEGVADPFQVTRLGVVASLLFVGLEVRQNTAAVRGATYQSIADASQEHTLWFADDPHIRELTARVQEGAVQSDFTEAENLMISAKFAMTIRRLENIYVQIREGLVPEAAVLEEESMGGEG